MKWLVCEQVADVLEEFKKNMLFDSSFSSCCVSIE